MLLRTLSAFEAYRRLFRDAVTPQRVAEMFILRHGGAALAAPLLDRSAREPAAWWPMNSSAETERRVGALQAQLEFGEAAELAPEQLPAYLTDKIEQLQAHR